MRNDGNTFRTVALKGTKALENVQEQTLKKKSKNRNNTNIPKTTPEEKLIAVANQEMLKRFRSSLENIDEFNTLKTICSKGKISLSVIADNI